MVNLTRRFILGGILAAPAVIAYDKLMPVKLWTPPKDILVPGIYVSHDKEEWTLARKIIRSDQNYNDLGYRYVKVVYARDPMGGYDIGEVVNWDRTLGRSFA